MRNISGLLCITVIIVLISSCDQTPLSGKILAESNELILGKEYELTLEVPQDINGICRVHWEVEPANAASIQFRECKDGECERDSGYKQDRIAKITAIAVGEITVYVSGFYKQTNPQGITKIVFTVHK